MVLHGRKALVPGALVSMAAHLPSPPAPLTALPRLLALLRSVDAAFLPVVINEGLWSCVPIPDGLWFKGETTE